MAVPGQHFDSRVEGRTSLVVQRLRFPSPSAQGMGPSWSENQDPACCMVWQKKKRVEERFPNPTQDVICRECVCCVQWLSCIQLFATPWTDPHQALLSLGILQARILEWVAMPSSRRSSQSRYRSQVSHTAGRFFTI